MSSSSESDEEVDHRSVISKRSKGALSIHACPHPDCDKFFARPSRLETHLLSHTGERPFKCNVEKCGRDYARRAHLIRHTANAHASQHQKSDEKRVNCTQCKATFSNKYGLKKHWSKCHNQPNNETVKHFSCDQCGQSFSRRQNLQIHRARVHPDFEKPKYGCEVCKKHFLYPKLLAIHMKKHEENECDICHKKFQKWTAFRTHIAREHPRKFKCSVCFQKFKSNVALKLHESTVHSGERSVFLCTYENCEREYLFEKNLKCHIKVDHEGQRFSCPVDGCNSVFKAKITLKRHTKNVHGRVAQSDGKSKNKKPKQPRRPRKDKGVHKSSVALELTGFSSDMNEKLTKNIIMKSGKVYLSAEGLSEEISENLISSLERKPDVKTETESSDVESQFDSKNPCNIPDLLIPMRLSILSSTDKKDDEDETPEKCNGNLIPDNVKKYDFSSFLS